MSQLTAAPNLLAAIGQDCVDAWGLTDKSVDYGQPRLPKKNLPYAVIDILDVEMDFSGKGVEQTYQFSIIGRFAFPETGNIVLEKIARANELIAQLIDGPNYKGLAYLPIVRAVQFEETDPTLEKAYEVAILFECKVREPHHPGAFGA